MKEIKTIEGCFDLIKEVSLKLKPDSRYISELYQLLHGASSLQEIESRLLLSRGKFFTKDLFESMTLSEKIYSCLITAETYELRFNSKEYFVLEKILKDSKSILSMPCSLGLEVKTIHKLCSDLFLSPKIFGCDIQVKYVEHAKKHYQHLADFFIFDAMTDTLPQKYDIIFCRNFLGYFPESISSAIIDKLLMHTEDKGYVILDDFFVSNHLDVIKSKSMVSIDKTAIFQKN